MTDTGVTKMVWLSLLLLAVMKVQNAVSESCFSDGTLRLVQTSFIGLGNAGRVEICMGGVWGTISDYVPFGYSPWREKTAQVACIQLGFSGALNTIFQTTIPSGDHADPSVPVHLYDVLCTGVERYITQCHSLAMNFRTTHESADAYVVCRPNRTIRYSDVHVGGPQSGDIRLFGHVFDSSGAVQIYSSANGWQAICPDGSWTDSDADTICKDLGYKLGWAISPISASSGPGGVPISRRLYNAVCPAEPGSRNRYGVCAFGVGVSDTSHCNLPAGQYASLFCVQVAGSIVRLFGGNSSRKGIVEIVYDGRWGMVCDDGFSSEEAQVICQELGYGRDNARVMRLTSNSAILVNESNLKPIWLTQLKCNSSHHSLHTCAQNTKVIIGYANCTSSNTAAVDCGDPPILLTSGQIAGMALGTMAVVFIICLIIVLVYRKYYLRNRRIAHRERQLPRTTPATLLNFDLHPQNPETEPSSNDLSNPGLSQAPPPSYRASCNFPTHDPSTDLPPPYSTVQELPYPLPLQPTTSEQLPYPPTPVNVADAYTSPLSGVNYQGYPLPSNSSNPPPSRDSTTRLAYPSGNMLSVVANPVNTVTVVTTSTSRGMSLDSVSDSASGSVGSGGGSDGD